MRGAALRSLGALGLVGVLTSGCGFASALADPQAAAASRAAEASAATPTPMSPAEPVAPLGPVTLAGVDIATADGRQSDHLSVVRRPTQTGLVPPLEGFTEDCDLDSTTLQYVAVTIDFDRDELAGHLTVEPTAETPTDIGPIGVFFDGAAEPYCQDDPPLQLTDTFWWHGSSGGEVVAYLVLQDAVDATHPEGRPEVFSTLDVRIDQLRVHSRDDEPFRLSPPQQGQLCADDPDALCLSLP
ncbi:hypothetical protein [Modestobacter sp. Leaf380]|uniref:hypothetical protein n=1 Tax=Modestobacter sp. Leaf380 TaxID=1736356 RepID=UPI0006F611F6|nr:hypothetical protein [Modestobacter sp. Leaf380]KQS69842.1 hypothetical protein ASG41_21325 [Modestobacter sp. Leaf380]